MKRNWINTLKLTGILIVVAAFVISRCKGPNTTIPTAEKTDAPTPSIQQSDTSTYYTSTNGLKGPELKLALHKLIRNHKTYTYNQVWDLIAKTDQDPNDSNHVILLYTGRSQAIEQRDRGGNYDYESHNYIYNDAYNREHVWAKSHGFPNKSDTAYTDLHHIKPADRSVNSARNTRSFCECNVPYKDNGGAVPTTCFKGDDYSWEPREEVKGDVARILFYMAVRYEGSYDLELVDYVEPSGTKSCTHGKLSTLLEWHIQDPVDDFERQRNEIIFQYQGNRNPFIDHPEFVKLIW